MKLKVLLALLTLLAPQTGPLTQVSADGDYLSLPNGYRIDTESCTDPVADRDAKTVVALVRAANRVADDLLGCLMDVNPEAAASFQATLQSLHPTLYCAGRAGTHKKIAKEMTISKTAV